MATIETPPTFETEQVQPTELERLVERMNNFSVNRARPMFHDVSRPSIGQ